MSLLVGPIESNNFQADRIVFFNGGVFTKKL